MPVRAPTQSPQPLVDVLVPAIRPTITPRQAPVGGPAPAREGFKQHVNDDGRRLRRRRTRRFGSAGRSSAALGEQVHSSKVRSGGVLLAARRLDDTYKAGVAGIRGESSGTLDLPRGHADDAWHVRARGGSSRTDLLTRPRIRRLASNKMPRLLDEDPASTTSASSVSDSVRRPLTFFQGCSERLRSDLGGRDRGPAWQERVVYLGEQAARAATFRAQHQPAPVRRSRTFPTTAAPWVFPTTSPSETPSHKTIE